MNVLTLLTIFPVENWAENMAFKYGLGVLAKDKRCETFMVMPQKKGCDMYRDLGRDLFVILLRNIIRVDSVLRI